MKNAVVPVVTILLIGTLAGLGVAIGYRKIPRHWFRPGTSGTTETSRPAPLFYSVIGDSNPEEPSVAGPKGAEDSPLERKYTIEIGVLDSRESAEALVKKLADSGLNAYFTPLLKDGRVIFRVRHGIFDSEATAKSTAKTINSRHKLKATVGEM